MWNIFWIFLVCAPPVRYAPPVLEHVPLHGKSLCKDLERASVGANNMRPLSWGGAQTENIPFFTAEIYFAFTANNIIDTFISTERHYFCFRFKIGVTNTFVLQTVTFSRC